MIKEQQAEFTKMLELEPLALTLNPSETPQFRIQLTGKMASRFESSGEFEWWPVEDATFDGFDVVVNTGRAVSVRIYSIGRPKNPKNKLLPEFYLAVDSRFYMNPDFECVYLR